ncbi:MAG TPA: YciI family protein [Solirubrobacteraceae bacterium]|nr:YciI family protein [Solirubrobacteraceae bacterium]
MRFLMLVCRDASIPFGPADRATIGDDVRAWVSEMEQRGVRLLGNVLAPPERSTRVSTRSGDVIIEDGAQGSDGVPASGFNLLECADLDEAIEVSAKHPIAKFGLIELRPIIDD